MGDNFRLIFLDPLKSGGTGSRYARKKTRARMHAFCKAPERRSGCFLRAPPIRNQAASTQVQRAVIYDQELSVDDTRSSSDISLRILLAITVPENKIILNMILYVTISSS